MRTVFWFIIDFIEWWIWCYNQYTGWRNYFGRIIYSCSDGLSNFLSEPDIIDAVTKNSPETASDMMERKLLSEEIGAPDNFTWYIIHIDEII